MLSSASPPERSGQNETNAKKKRDSFHILAVAQLQDTVFNFNDTGRRERESAERRLLPNCSLQAEAKRVEGTGWSNWSRPGHGILLCLLASVLITEALANSKKSRE